MANQISELDFLTRRLYEWTLLRSISLGKPWAAAQVTTASDWFQRKAAETVTSPAALTLLANEGRTRRVRAAASRRLVAGLVGADPPPTPDWAERVHIV